MLDDRFPTDDHPTVRIQLCESERMFMEVAPSAAHKSGMFMLTLVQIKKSEGMEVHTRRSVSVHRPSLMSAIEQISKWSPGQPTSTQSQ